MNSFQYLSSSSIIIVFLLLTSCYHNNIDAFSMMVRPSLLSSLSTTSSISTTTTSSLFMSTTTAPPREKTKTNRKTNNPKEDNNDDNRSTDPNDIMKYNDAPMEYLEDEWSTRNPNDPYHILLLDTTFTKNERITISYISGCVTYVLGMPDDDARELTTMAAENGFSCLGTWEREECLKLGRQLQVRDCVVRVVPYCQGGNRGWQAKDASDGGYSSNNSSYGGRGDSGGADYSFNGGNFFE